MKLKYYLRGLGIGVLVSTLIMSIALGNKKTGLSDDEIRQRAAELGMVEETTTLAQMAEKNLENIEDNEKTEDAAADESKETASTEESKESVASDELKENATDDSAKDNKNNADTVTAEAEEVKAEDVKAPEADTKNDKSGEEVKSDDKKADDKKVDEKSDDKKADEKADDKKSDDKKTDDKKSDDKKADEKSDDNKSKEENADDRQVIIVDDSSEVIVIQVNSGEGSGTVAQKVYDAGLVDNAHDFDVFLMTNGYDRRITVGRHEIPKGASMRDIGIILNSAAK